jgi:hypothetical protein
MAWANFEFRHTLINAFQSHEHVLYTFNMLSGRQAAGEQLEKIYTAPPDKL